MTSTTIAGGAFAAKTLRRARAKQTTTSLPVFDDIVRLLTKTDAQLCADTLNDLLDGEALSAGEWQLLDVALDDLRPDQVEAEIAKPTNAAKFIAPFGKCPSAMSSARRDLARHLEFCYSASRAVDVDVARTIPAFATSSLSFLRATAEATLELGLRPHAPKARFGKLCPYQIVPLCTFAERIATAAKAGVDVNEDDARALLELYPELDNLTRRRNAVIEAVLSRSACSRSAIAAVVAAAAGFDVDVAEAFTKLDNRFRLSARPPRKMPPLIDQNMSVDVVAQHLRRLKPRLDVSSDGRSTIRYDVATEEITPKAAARIVRSALEIADVDSPSSVPVNAMLKRRRLSGREGGEYVTMKDEARQFLAEVLTHILPRPPGGYPSVGVAEECKTAVQVLRRHVVYVELDGELLGPRLLVLKTTKKLDAEEADDVIAAARLLVHTSGIYNGRNNWFNSLEVVVGAAPGDQRHRRRYVARAF